MYYTSIDHYKGKILCRLIDNLGNSVSKTVNNFQPFLLIPNEKKSKYKDIYGNNLRRMDFDNPYELYSWYRDRKDLMDIFGSKNMVQQYIPRNFNVENLVDEWDAKQIRICYYDIETTVTGKMVKADQASNPIYAITYYDSKTKRFSSHIWNGVGNSKSDKSGSFILEDSQFKDNLDLYTYNSEAALLSGFLVDFNKKQFHIISGFNVDAFDNPYLINRIKIVLGENRAKTISPWNIIDDKIIKVKLGNQFIEEEGYKIFGIASLDYLNLYRKYQLQPRPNHKLDTISEIELGENKLHHHTGIPGHLLYREYFHDAIEYNIQDVALLPKLEEKLGFIELVLTFAYYSGSNYEDILSPIRTWHNIIYNYLYEKNIFYEIRKEIPERIKFSGGYVGEPIPGRYYNIASYDVTSLYPTIIRMLNISPETMLDKTGDLSYINNIINGEPIEIKNKNACIAPNGVEYDTKKQGFATHLVEKMFFERVKYKQKTKLYSQLSKLSNDDISEMVLNELNNRR